MRTSGILTVGGAIVAVLGALLALLIGVPTGGKAFTNVVGFVFFAAIALVGVLVFVAGRRRARLEKENDERGFADLATALARKNGGQVGIDAVARASGLPGDEATAKMRQLTGRGVFELDFDQNGQMVYKLSANPGAAQLAELASRS